MYKITFFFFILFSIHTSYSQENYLEIIADKACECIQERKNTKATVTKGELGACLFKYAGDYKAEFKKDHNLDIASLGGENGTRLGELLGSKMMFICPDLLMEFASDEPNENSITGKITGITDKTTVLFELTTTEGKRQKFYWLRFIQTDFDIQKSYKNLKEKEVTIEYIEEDIFDPRIQEYRQFGVITSLKVN